MNLDKLRILTEAYNPASSQRTAESVDAHHKLALLAHYLLLPMAEALEFAVVRCCADEDLEVNEECSCEWCQCWQKARAVLAKLEEALK